MGAGIGNPSRTERRLSSCCGCKIAWQRALSPWSAMECAIPHLRVSIAPGPPLVVADAPPAIRHRFPA